MNRWFTAALLGLSLAAAPAVAADALRVAVVDMDALVKAHPRYETNRDILKQQLDKAREERDAVEAELMKMQEAYLEARRAARDPAVSDAVRAERETAARERGEEFQKRGEEAQERLMQRQRELNEQRETMYKAVESLVRAVVRDYAADEKIDLVIDRAAMGVSGADVLVYCRESFDVTDEVLQRMKAPADR